MPRKDSIAIPSDGPMKRASASFREQEIDAMRQVLRALRAGRDVSVMLRSEAFRSVEMKFMRMEPKVITKKEDG